MDDILKQLFHGDLREAERSVEDLQKTKEFERLEEAYNALLKTLSTTQRELFEAYYSAHASCISVENERFYTLLSQKHYDKEYILLPELFGAFSDIYDEKVRLELIGVELDNLLNSDKSNPALRTPKEIEKIIADECLEWQRKVDALETSEAYQNADESQRTIMLRALIKDDME